MTERRRRLPCRYAIDAAACYSASMMTLSSSRVGDVWLDQELEISTADRVGARIKALEAELDMLRDFLAALERHLGTDRSIEA